jgi:hypothetical protein
VKDVAVCDFGIDNEVVFVLVVDCGGSDSWG